MGDYTSIQDPCRGGFVHTIFSGLFNLLPYTLDILSPKYSSRLRRYLAAHEPKTRLVYKKENQENEKGWDLEGRIARATAILKGSGFSDNFSPYVFILGHGSSSLNNPHEAAHDCGACAGDAARPTGVFLQPSAMNLKFERGWQKTA